MGGFVDHGKRILAALCLLLVVNGCSTSKGYLLVHDARTWGERIREELPAGQRVKLALIDGGQLHGTVRAAEADSLRIVVRKGADRVGTEVALPYGRIASVEALDYSFSKTVFTVFTGALCGILFILTVFPPDISLG
ncbi:MAG: hypothetical protein IPH09_08915 [bacterium]|nr:hypothetical protein [bacterium]